MDPRFLVPCRHRKLQGDRNQALSNSLLSLETIVETELKNMEESPEKKAKSCGSKIGSPNDPDEGFFDRSAISPGFEDSLLLKFQN